MAKGVAVDRVLGGLKCPNKCLHVEKANQQTGNFREKGVKGLEAKAKANHGRAHTQ